MTIILISANRCSSPYTVFPLGITHLAAALRQAGHTVHLLDLLCDDSIIEQEVLRIGPALIGISLRNIDDTQITQTRYFALDVVALTRRLKSVSSAPIVLGGSAYSLFPRKLMELSGATYGVAGEGESAIVELAAALECKSTVDHIPRLVYRSNDRIVINPPKCPTAKTMHVAIRDERLTRFYLNVSRMLNLQTQRGCAFTCCYCTYPLIEGSTPRFRPAIEVGEEVAQMSKQGCRYFFIVDSVFNTSQEHVAGICEELIRQNTGIKFGCFLRPSHLTAELMSLMKHAGLSHIEFGSDSFCDPVLDAYGKNFCFEEIYHSSELAREAGIHYSHFLIMGGPGETEATMQESFANSNRLKKTVHFPFVGMRIFPGTPLYHQAISERIITDQTDLLPPFFYVSPHISKDHIFKLLNEFNTQAKNWIIAEPPPELVRVANDLRAKGVTGPLWEFLAR